MNKSEILDKVCELWKESKKMIKVNKDKYSKEGIEKYSRDERELLRGLERDLKLRSVYGENYESGIMRDIYTIIKLLDCRTLEKCNFEFCLRINFLYNFLSWDYDLCENISYFVQDICLFHDISPLIDILQFIKSVSDRYDIFGNIPRDNVFSVTHVLRTDELSSNEYDSIENPRFEYASSTESEEEGNDEEDDKPAANDTDDEEDDKTTANDDTCNIYGIDVKMQFALIWKYCSKNMDKDTKPNNIWSIYDFLTKFGRDIYKDKKAMESYCLNELKTDFLEQMFCETFRDKYCSYTTVPKESFDNVKQSIDEANPGDCFILMSSTDLQGDDMKREILLCGLFFEDNKNIQIVSEAKVDSHKEKRKRDGVIITKHKIEPCIEITRQNVALKIENISRNEILNQTALRNHARLPRHTITCLIKKVLE